VQTNQISFCWSGEKVFVTTAHGRTRILSYPDFEPVMRLAYDNGDGDGSDEFMLDGHTSSCLSAELQPNGRYLATGGSDSIIALWDTQEWICQRTLTSMVGPVRSISMLIALPSCPIATGPTLIPWTTTLMGFCAVLGFTFDGSYVVGGSDEGELGC
jgi:THO complex subunit 3